MHAVTTFVIAALFNAIAAQSPHRAVLNQRNLNITTTSVTSTPATASIYVVISTSGGLAVVATAQSSSAAVSQSKFTAPPTSNLSSPPPRPAPPPQTCLSNWDALASCAEETQQRGQPYLPTSSSSDTAPSHAITFPLLSSGSISTLPHILPTLSSSTTFSLSIASSYPTAILHTGLLSSSISGSSSSQSSQSLLIPGSRSDSSSTTATTSFTTFGSSTPPNRYTSESTRLPSSPISLPSTTGTSPFQFSLTSKAPSTQASQSKLFPWSTTVAFPTTDIGQPGLSLTSQAPSTHSSQPQLTSSSSVSQRSGEAPTYVSSPHSSLSSPPSKITTASSSAILIGTQTITEDSSSHFRIGSLTLLPGSVLTVDGQRVSLASSGNALVINGVITNPPSSTKFAIIVVGGSTLTANSATGFVVGSQTLYPGSAITASGVVMTLPKGSAAMTAGPAVTSKVIVVGSSTFTEDSKSDLLIGTQTLARGGIITIDGQVVSLSPSGNGLVINGKTSKVSSSAPTTLATSFGSLISVSPISSLAIAGQTLTAGGKVTVGGDILSLAPSGTGITVVGTVTIGVAVGGATSTGAEKNHAGKRVQRGTGILALPFLLVGVFWLQ